MKRLTYIVLVFGVGPIHHLQEADLDLRLVQETLFVLNDFDGHVTLFLVVVGLHHLPGGEARSKCGSGVRKGEGEGAEMFLSGVEAATSCLQS